MRFQKMNTKFQSSMNYSQDTTETIDIEDVEVLDVAQVLLRSVKAAE